MESVCYDRSCLEQAIDYETYKLATALKDTINVGVEGDNAVEGDCDDDDDGDAVRRRGWMMDDGSRVVENGMGEWGVTSQVIFYLIAFSLFTNSKISPPP